MRDRGAPAWVRGMMRADLVRQLPGDETYAVANATIDSWFRTMGVEPVWLLHANQSFTGILADNQPLPGWPDSFDSLLFHEGAWLFLDGGVLDLGIVRDSTLNSTNDLQIFAETFEAVAMVGVESWCLRMDVCASGKSSAADDFDPCVTGS